MTMMSDRRPILLANARIVDPSRDLDIIGDLLIADGVVREAKKGIGAAGVPEGTDVIDCRGKLVAPGLVDMPSNFVDYAIDFSGDGRADIWSNVPDVLASTANYLRKWKWNPTLPWGFEVLVPDGFDYMFLSSRSIRPMPRITTMRCSPSPTRHRTIAADLSSTWLLPMSLTTCGLDQLSTAKRSRAVIQSTFPTALCRCYRSGYRTTSARCVQMKTARRLQSG